jgi:hypothetical protein
MWHDAMIVIESSLVATHLNQLFASEWMIEDGKLFEFSGDKFKGVLFFAMKFFGNHNNPDSKLLSFLFFLLELFVSNL